MFRLKDLEKFQNITIQCHDNPDADSIGSGFALYCYFKKKGNEVNALTKIFEFIVKFIPIKLIANYFLKQFEEYALRTDTQVDEYGLLALWSVLYVLGLADEPPKE